MAWNAAHEHRYTPQIVGKMTLMASGDLCREDLDTLNDDTLIFVESNQDGSIPDEEDH